MLKLLHGLFYKKNSKDKSDFMHTNMTAEEESYDMLPSVVQDYENKYEEKYESFPVVEKNLSEGDKDKDYCGKGKNRYIKIHKENKIYGEGTYIVGENGLLPGLYYAWNNYKVIIGRNNSFSSGSWGCDDGYIRLTTGRKVIIESGKITSVDNIIYTYNRADYLIPGHVYLVGREVPNGRYRILFDETYVTGDDDLEKQCIFHRVAEEQDGLSYNVRSNEGFADTDSKTNYVILKNGKAILVEEGVFHPNDGPEVAYNFRKRKENEKRIEKLRKEMEVKYQEEEYGEYVSYYCAINEPIAEIVILEYFTKFAKVEKMKNLFSDDFSVNYKIEIPISLIDVQCLLCVMFYNKYITAPAAFGIVLADIFKAFNLPALRTDRKEVFEKSFANYKKRNPGATIEELDKFRSRMEAYQKRDNAVHNAIDILKSRISSDTCKVMKKYCKIYPFKVIDKESYYISHVPAKYIKQYVGNKCPMYLYYYMSENRDKYEQEYSEVILNLKEQGLIKSRWKNEFSLYMIIKSYFPSAIYQYHAEWLEKQSLDIYIPEHRIGIEYQGKQHYEEVGLFNGIDGLIETQKRDKIKREKCKLNGVTLIEWVYTDEVEEQKLIDILKNLNIPIPQKNDITTFYKIDTNKSDMSNKRTTTRELQRVCQYDLDGNYLNSYESVDVAADDTGVSKESIRRVCSGVRNTGGGYMWRRYCEEEIPKKIGAYSKEVQTSTPRKISQYNVSGEIIETYDSISEAVRKTGINAKSIRENAKGKQNHAGGYIWKYVDTN